MDLSALISAGLAAAGLSTVWLIPITVLVHVLVAKFFPNLNIPSLLGSSTSPPTNPSSTPSAPVLTTPTVTPTVTPSSPVTVPATPNSASTPGPLLGLLQGVLDLKSSGTVTPAAHPLLSFLSSELAALTNPPAKS